jgi:hypothetical protein
VTLVRNDALNLALDTGDNPYLMDGYAPVDTEIDAEDLEVIGEIPADLNGLYVRNGPNPMFTRPAATTGSTATACCTPSTSRRPRDLPQPLGAHRGRRGNAAGHASATRDDRALRRNPPDLAPGV